MLSDGKDKILVDLLKIYFLDAQIDRLDWIADGKKAGGKGAYFSVDSTGSLIVSDLPDDVWVKERFEEYDRDRGFWHIVAYIKARYLDDTPGLIEKAISGELYNEDYYTKRGNSSPYVNYPYEDGGTNLADRFRSLAAEIVEKFNPGAVLDCGCATGVLVKAFHDIGIEASGIDVSEYATSHAITGNIYKARGDNMPFGDGVFDVIVSQDFMEHIHPNETNAVINEQTRVLRVGGRICHFIPFEPGADIPVQFDAHLCNASFKWWLTLFKQFDRLLIVQEAPEHNQWDFSKGDLARYFILEKIS